ncbi:MAG: stalk domain-containing protein [Caldiserica bacterium]|nr:stalk domain-containing protein [Caldisericota bacterium]
MRESVRFVLTLVLCLVLSLSSVLVGVPAARGADTGVWTQLPLYGGGVFSLVINPATPTTLYAGTYSGGVFRSTDSGATWTAVNTGLTSQDIRSLAINPATPTTLYAGIWGGGVFRSTDSGTIWTALNTGLTHHVVWSLAINPLTPTTLYSGTYDGVFRSTDSGTTWTAVNTGLTNQHVQSLAINPLIPAILYAGTTLGGGVFRSVDSGATWSAVNTGLSDRWVQSLAINPLIPAILYAGTRGGVFRSTDSGTTWTAVNTGLTHHVVWSLAINPLTSTTLYAGTYGGGVFRSTDSGAHWTAVNTGLTSQDIRALAINPATPSILYVGTYDVGVFQYELVSSYALTTNVSPSTGGSISRSPDTASYTSGTVVTLTAAPAAGYVFIGWSGDLSGPPTNPPTITMDANKTVTATFAAKVKSFIELKIGSSTMHVNGRPVVLEAAPIILNSRTLLPIRAVLEAVGGTIAWEASTRKVTIVRQDKTLELWIGRNVAQLNGQSVTIDSDAKVVPIIMSGRTLLPLRFVAEALALDVQWNATTKAITITYTP